MLNRIGNSDIRRFCFDSKNGRVVKSLVSPTRQNTVIKIKAVTETGENVLNCVNILLFNCLQSSFPLCDGFSNSLEGDLPCSIHLFVITALTSKFESTLNSSILSYRIRICIDLRTESVGLSTPNLARYLKCSNAKD